MSRNIFDWKFWSALSVALASLFATLFVWYQDQNSKSLSIEVLTSTDLNPKSSNKIDGFEMRFKEVLVTDPFLQIVEIKNSGSKPISSADFEDSLRLSFGDDTKILRANLDSVLPADIEPKYFLKEDKFYLLPLLLNAGDSIKFSFLTSGSKPLINSKVRVAGVSLKIKDVLSEPRKIFGISQLKLFMSLLMFIYFMCTTMAGLDFIKHKKINYYFFFIALVSMNSSIYMYGMGVKIYNLNYDRMDLIRLMIIPGSVAIFISFILLLKHIKSKSRSNILQ